MDLRKRLTSGLAGGVVYKEELCQANAFDTGIAALKIAAFR